MRPGGANATNAAAYALGRELRRIRVARGITPKQLEGITGIPRNKIDALELGELGSARSRKRAGHISRGEALDLFLSHALGTATETAQALLFLAHEADAMSPAEVYEPIGAAELRAHGREPPRSGGDRSSAIDGAVRALLAAHPFPGEGERPRTTRPLARPVWEVPAARCSRFVGREAETRSLREALLGDGPSVIVVSGAGGTGKSELVRAVVDDPRIRERFRACAWITAREHEFLGRPPISERASADPLVEIASQLGIAHDRLADALAQEPILVVLDNAEALADEDGAISKLGRMTGESKVVVTSRNRSTASFVLPFPAAAPLHGLPVKDAVALLGHELAARARTTVDAATLARIARVSGGAPLALHWIAGRAPAEPVATLVRALEDGGAEELYDFMFGRAWEELAPPARRLMRVLAYETVEPVPREVLAEQTPSGKAGALLARLSDASIVEAAGPVASVGLHPLARGFVRARARPVPGHAGRAHRALRYLVTSLADDARGSGAALPLGGLRNHLRWMEELAAVEPVLVMIAWTKLSRYLWEHWHWHLYEECSRIGASAAGAIGRTARAAGLLLRALPDLDMTYLRFEQGRLDEALALGERARAVFDDLGDDAGLCLVHRYLGVVRMEAGDQRSLTAARRHWDGALEAIGRAREHGYPRRRTRMEAAARQLEKLGLWDTIRGGYGVYRGAWAPSEAELHTLLGDHAVRLGDLPRAARVLENAVRLYESAEGRWPGSEAAPMLALAGCHQRFGRATDAEAMYERALAIAERTERRDIRAAALIALARVSGRAPGRAAAFAREAKGIFEHLGQARNVADANALLARLSSAYGFGEGDGRGVGLARGAGRGAAFGPGPASSP